MLCHRPTELIANETTDLNGISLLHFSPDLAQGAVNPTYFQDFEGLLNITSPTAAGDTSPLQYTFTRMCVTARW